MEKLHSKRNKLSFGGLVFIVSVLTVPQKSNELLTCCQSLKVEDGGKGHTSE